MTAEATPPRRANPPIWPKIPADFVRAVLKGHSALGLAFAAAIYLVCLTGSVAVFAHEFRRWESPAGPMLEQASPEAVQRAFAAAVARAGEGLEHVYITLPTPSVPRLAVTTDAKVEKTWTADAQGRLTGAQPQPWTSFITDLHINLHLPRVWGRFLVGMTGVALLSSVISGLLAHPRIFRDAFHLRLGGSRRLQEADLHNRIGVWGLPFHVLLSLSGALLGLTTLIVGVLGMAVFNGDVNKVYSLFQPLPPKEDPRPAPVPDLRPMFARIPRDGTRIEYVLMEHPTERGGAVMFNVRHPDRLSGSDAYAFKTSGELYRKDVAAKATLGEKLLGALGILHFGWFGGGLIKIAYGLLGLGLSYLAANGVFIWLQRRRDKGRPAPGWERVWMATVWGQPAALAAAAAVAVVASGAGVGGPVAAWLVVSAAFLAAAVRAPASLLTRAGQGATGLLMTLAGLAHAGLNGAAATDPMIWIVDGVLLVLGLGLLSLCVRGWRADLQGAIR